MTSTQRSHNNFAHFYYSVSWRTIHSHNIIHQRESFLMSSVRTTGIRIEAMVGLANTWNPDKHDVTGWLMSEKLDGMRAVWDGHQLYSRTGKVIHAPPEFLSGLPAGFGLDGELFMGRGNFDQVISVCRKHSATPGAWKGVVYKVFDAPLIEQVGLTKRLDAARSALAEHAGANEHVEIVEHTVCRGKEHVQETLTQIEAVGGEGLMLAVPDKAHRGKRSNDLLKVKSMVTDDAIVVGHGVGEGKHADKLGALECVLRSGVPFRIGTGFSDEERLDPPQVGDVVEFKYFELTKAKVPRFPAYVRIRPDVEASEFPSMMARGPDDTAAGGPSKRRRIGE